MATLWSVSSWHWIMARMVGRRWVPVTVICGAQPPVHPLPSSTGKEIHPSAEEAATRNHVWIWKIWAVLGKKTVLVPPFKILMHTYPPSKTSGFWAFSFLPSLYDPENKQDILKISVGVIVELLHRCESQMSTEQVCVCLHSSRTV